MNEIVDKEKSLDQRNSSKHRLALAFGALPGYCAFGFEVASPDVANMIFHGIVSLITIVLMVLLTLKVAAHVRALS